MGTARVAPVGPGSVALRFSGLGRLWINSLSALDLAVVMQDFVGSA